MDGHRSRGAVLIQDKDSYLPLSEVLSEEDVVLLLTPGVAPGVVDGGNNSETPSGDPFEPLGRALARYHPRVRHVPYTPRNGITGTHVVHIRSATNVVFVISGPPHQGQQSQVELAKYARAVSEHRPQIIVACCSTKELGDLDKSFPTIIQAFGYSASDLESVAELLFHGPSPQALLTAPEVQNLLVSPKAWKVDEWDPSRDLPMILDLWCQSLPRKFHLSEYGLRSLLQRDGYGKHYVVREPGTSHVLGFCATYTTFPDSPSPGERLIGSLAAIVVRSSYRQRGIGLSLHDHAVRRLTSLLGVRRLQLGTTFPRLFYGLPFDLHVEDWFRRRGWRLDSHTPGSGQETCDWLLKFDDWPSMGFSASGLQFRQCSIGNGEFDMVLNLVGRESRRKDNMGWYTQYAMLANTMNMQDVVIGIVDDNIVATAITYIRQTGSPVQEDLPWAGTISPEVGGVTCICIPDESPWAVNKRDTIMIRLLDACIRILKNYGVKQLFIDAVKGGDEGFQFMGFQKWARYREVWRDV